MPFRIGPVELAIILVIVLIIFGVGRLPQIGGAMGQAIREFRKHQSGKSSIAEALEPEETEKEKETSST